MNQIHPEIQRIKERRQKLGATQGELALCAQLSKSALAQLEVGMRSNPQYDTVQKLHAALDALEKEKLRAERQRLNAALAELDATEKESAA